MMLQTFWLPSPRGNRLLPSATRPQALAGTSFDRAAPGPDGASRQVLRQGTFPARFRVLCPINGPAAEEFHFGHISQFGTGFSCGNGVGSFQVVAVSGALKKIEEERSKGDHGEPQVPWDWGSLYQARRRFRSFFDSVSQQWLIRFLKHRINDTRMLRLIQKWLKAGVLEDW